MATVCANIAEHLERMARKQPACTAVAVQRARLLDGAIQYREATFEALHRRGLAVARGFLGEGIQPGTRTVVMVKPGLEFFCIVFALFRIGAVPVLVDPGMGVRNLKACLDRARPEAFIGVPKAHAARVLLRWATRTIRIRITVGPRLFWGGTRLRWITLGSKESGVGEGSAGPEDPGLEISARGAEPAIALPEENDTAAILFTSGSTGTPKGAVYTHAIFQDQIECLRDVYGIEPGERDVATFPLFALFGPALGMTCVIPAMDATRPARARPERIAAAVRDWEATNLFASPALLERLGRWAEAGCHKLPTLRRVISAGAPAEPAVLQRVSKMLERGREVFTPYGATEALPVCSIGSRGLLVNWPSVVPRERAYA